MGRQSFRAATSSLTRRGFLGTSAALGAATLLPACKPMMSGLFVAADAHPAGYPTVEAVEFMGRYLAERTNGRLGIRSFPGGQLGSETDTLELTSFGGIDLNRVNFAPLNSIEPMTLPFSLPFVFDSVDHMRRVVDSATGDAVLAAMEPHGLIGLCIYDSGARSFYNDRGPINSPDDMRGLKIRVPASDLYIAMVNALGANAVPIPFGEIYQSLAQGVIDGAENNWPTFVGEGHYEVATYLSLTQHLLTPEALVMSRETWEGLSPDDRGLMREAAKASVVEMRRLWDIRVAEARAVVEASDVVVNEVDSTPFSEIMRPVWDQFIVTPEQREIVRQIQNQAGR